MRQHASLHNEGERRPDEAAEAATEVGADDLGDIKDDYAFEQVMHTILCAIAIAALLAGFVAMI